MSKEKEKLLQIQTNLCQQVHPGNQVDNMVFRHVIRQNNTPWLRIIYEIPACDCKCLNICAYTCICIVSAVLPGAVCGVHGGSGGHASHGGLHATV